MTGPEHYREAERLLAQADRWESNVTDDLDSYAAIDGSRQAAQVHATLALADATHNISDLLDVGTLAVRVQS